MEKTDECICGGKAVLRFHNVSLFGGKLVLKNQPYWHCTKSGDHYHSTDQTRKSDEVVKQFISLQKNGDVEKPLIVAISRKTQKSAKR